LLPVHLQRREELSERPRLDGIALFCFVLHSNHREAMVPDEFNGMEWNGMEWNALDSLRCLGIAGIRQRACRCCLAQQLNRTFRRKTLLALESIMVKGVEFYVQAEWTAQN
jgi:hypothetical protein